jgi:hypothetical protein
MVTGRIAANQNTIKFTASRDTNSLEFLTTTHFPSGTQYTITLWGSYLI